MSESEHIRKNAPAIFMLILTLFTSTMWTLVTFPNSAVNGVSVFIEGVVYLLFLIFTFIGFLACYSIPENNFVRFIDFGDPQHMWRNIIIGLGLGVLFAGSLLGGTAQAALAPFTIMAPILMFFTAFVGPLVETLFFQGLFLPTADNGFHNVIPGILIISAIFTGFHHNTWGLAGWMGYLFPFIFSVVLCVITIYMKSILPAIMIHMTVNTAIAFAQFAAPAAAAVTFILRILH